MTWATWVCEYEHKKVESRMSKVYTQLCINYSSSSETILMYNSVQTTVHCTRCQSLKKCTNKHKRYVICRLCNICTVLLALANWNSARYMKWTGVYSEIDMKIQRKLMLCNKLIFWLAIRKLSIMFLLLLGQQESIS